MKVTDDEIIGALKACRGTVCIVAERLNITRKTVYDHAHKNPKVQEAMDDAREALIDKAELALHSAVIDAQPWAVTLALKTIGRHRGYVERQEIEADATMKMYGQEANVDEV